MDTYLTLDGDVLDLTRLTPDERAYLERAVAAYRGGMGWEAFRHLSLGENPVIAGLGGGWITRAVHAHPLYRALRDMEDRIAVREGEIAPAPGDAPDRDPFADAWVSVQEAAARKGVTVQGVHKAIERGAVLARPAKPGGSWLVVSANSLARWTPNPVRQAAARRRVSARAG